MLKKSLQISLLGLAALAPMQADAQTFEGGDDLALIWIGDRHRPDWTKELFTPYLVHTYEDGHKSWFFDGFIFLDGQYWDENHVKHYSFGEVPGSDQAPKEVWEILLDRQLGTYSGFGVRALDERIGELKAEMGTDLKYKHKVVLMTPIPRIEQARNWGQLHGRQLNFEVLEDRALAMYWYVDLVIEKFKKADFKNVELAGIYWLREAIDSGHYEDKLAKLANDYIHEKELFTYWIPWFTAPFTEKSRDLGFDWTYIQPNYVFDLTTPDTRVQEATDLAWTYDIGLEMEFEGNCTVGYDAPTDTRTLIQQSNSSMYDANPKLFERFQRYIDTFEKEKCFAAMPLAYYNGFQAIFDFQNSKNVKDRQLLDRLAALLDQRHVIGEWYDEAASIEDIETEMRLNVYTTADGIFIGSGCPAATIYSIDGRTITTTTAGEEATVACEPGIYIVRCGDRSVKVRV